MLVHVINHTNATLYSDVLRDLFRVRHDIFVKEKQWVPPSDDGLEFDQYDTDDATYLVGLDDDGRVITGSRFIPADRPHMLTDIFHYTLERRTEDRTVAEWTRGFIRPDIRGLASARILVAFCAAVQQWAMEEGVTKVGGIQELYWLPLWRKMGWKVDMLGQTVEIDGAMCVPAYMEIAEDAREGAARLGRLKSSNLVRMGVIRGFVGDHADGEQRSIEQQIRG